MIFAGYMFTARANADLLIRLVIGGAASAVIDDGVAVLGPDLGSEFDLGYGYCLSDLSGVPVADFAVGVADGEPNGRGRARIDHARPLIRRPSVRLLMPRSAHTAWALLNRNGASGLAGSLRVNPQVGACNFQRHTC